jgi:prepilin-type N-terminal cleavage/methylation domain-containing protein
MAQKYTILKVLIQTSNRGFTLIELLVGLVITFIITGLAFDAFINSSNSFRNDQRNIDNSQNLSAILELVGNDIQQAGEQISEGTFPVIKIETNTDAGGKSGSSKITVRRALASSLTLCAPFTSPTPITVTASTVASLVVADDNPSTTSISANCSSGTLSTNIQNLAGSTPAAMTPSVIRPRNTLMAARRYRCKLDDPTINYGVYDTTPYTPDTIDFCLASKPASPAPDLEKIRASMSNASGNIWTFDYVNDISNTTIDTTTTPPTPRTTYSITIANMGTPPATAITYPVGTPIYLIEERIYTLDSDGNLNLQKDGGTAGTLIKGIQTFNVSAKVYTNTTDKVVDPIDGPTASGVVPVSMLSAARRCDPAIPNYICQFKSSTYPSDNWKTLAGIKVDLQAKYDGTGRNATPTSADIEKLSARAEFFPRNVLSK